MKKVLLIIILLTAAVFAQVEQQSPDSPSYSYSPSFYLDMANYKSETEGKTKVDIFVQVPYVNLQFVKLSDGFQARYSVHVSFTNKESGQIIREKLWNETVKSASFAATESNSNYNYSYQTFELEPGHYNLRAEVIDKDSRGNFVLTATANVADLSEPVAISDIILIDRTVNESIIPNVSRFVTDEDSLFSYFYEIYSEEDRTVTVEYRLADDENKVIYKEAEKMDLDEGTNFVKHAITSDNFTLGQFKLLIQLRDENLDLLTERQKTFFSKLQGFPVTITDLDKAIEQLAYIATQSEIDFIQDGDTKEDRLIRYKDFWKSKDPSPNTDVNEVFLEYYRRINYANEHFKHYVEGWRTDMGMIYITLGPPSFVERHPFDGNSKPYEIWEYYNISKRFVFLDETGFGDYRLINPEYGEWYRYR